MQEIRMASAGQTSEAAPLARGAARVSRSLVAAVALAYASLAAVGFLGQARLNDGQRAIGTAQAQVQVLRQQVSGAEALIETVRVAIRQQKIVSPGDADYDRSDLQLSQG
jgi:hypothetical protein